MTTKHSRTITMNQLLDEVSSSVLQEAEQIEADEKARWCWVLWQVARSLPDDDDYGFPVRHEALGGEQLEHHQHIRALAEIAPKPAEFGGCKSSTQTMRWACWAQGVCSAYGWTELAEMKRLNMLETWEAHKAKR